MVVVSEEALAEKRAAILALSLENSHEPKWGYFGYTGPLAIGDNSLAPQAKRKAEAADEGAEPLYNVKTNPAKKGTTPDVYFSFGPPLAIGDPYIDPMLRTKKPKCVPIDPEKMFKPAGKISYGINKLGLEYVPHCNGLRDPLAMHAKYKDYTAPRNFYTSPAKKGGAGVILPGVLFGDGEERKFYEHVPDDYDSARKIRKAELEAHYALLQEQQFKSMSYGNRCFFSDIETYFSEQPRGIPREVKPFDCGAYPHEAPFRPSHPSKKGYNATLQPFPEHVPDPIPAAATRKAPVEDAPPAWRPGNPREVCNPMPSVQTHMRNLRAEFPRSFVRPVL